MLIPFKTILETINFTPKGVIHVGACLGEDLDMYLAHGIDNLVFIEGNPVLIPRLKLKVGSSYPVIQALLSDKTGETVDFFLHYSYDRSNMGCSSLFEMSEQFKKSHPAIQKVGSIKVKTKTLDLALKEGNIDSNRYDFISMDVEGAELKVLHGAKETLKTTKAFLTEFSDSQRYTGQCVLKDLDEYLSDFGFKRVLTEYFDGKDYGDTLYLK